jgi:VIT1/CCC1 family predicted Fe2+/Mn2+ transporter
MLVPDIILARRLSNAVAMVMLCIAGYRLGRSGGRPPWVTGISLVVIGALLVSLCIALGG